jgi:hypothetical protein
MSNDSLGDAFLEAWNRTGDKYLTRNQIADLFGFSTGWVQLMIIRTDAKPRKISAINRYRVDYGLDMRLIVRQRNIVRYHVRQYSQNLYEAISDLGAAKPGTTEYLKALKQHEIAENGLKRNLERLKKLNPKDSLLKDAGYWLNEKA